MDLFKFFENLFGLDPDNNWTLIEEKTVKKENSLYIYQKWENPYGGTKETLRMKMNLRDMKQEKTLEEQLQEAVANENYKLAAELKEQINNQK